MKKAVAIFTVVVLVLSMTVGSFAAENNRRGSMNASSQGILGMTVATVLEDGQNRAEAIGDNAGKAERMAFRSAFAEKFQELEALRVTSRENWAAIKDLNDEIRTAAKELRVKNIELDEKDMNDIKVARAAIETVRTLISEWQSDKKELWKEFKDAVKAKNTEDAEAAIESILLLKQQIIDKQAAMIPLKQDLLKILTDFQVRTTPAASAL